MPLKGFRLTLPDNTVFRCSSDVNYRHTPQYRYLLNGFENVATLVEQWFDDTGGQSDKGDSFMQAFFAGVGAGVHTITVEFQQVKDSSDTWGSTAPSDPAATKLHAMSRALTTTRFGSDNVADLEIGEYASAEAYNPIPVVVLEADIGLSPDDPSAFGGTITFVEATDAGEPLDLFDTEPNE